MKLSYGALSSQGSICSTPKGLKAQLKIAMFSLINRGDEARDRKSYSLLMSQLSRDT